MSSKKKQHPNYQKPNIPQQQPVVQSSVVTASVAQEYKPSGDKPVLPIEEKKKESPNYKILAFRNDYERLENEVKKYLNDGWELAGGLATALHADNYATVTIFAQAVFKK